MSAITAKASRKMKKYAVLTREPRCFLGSFDFSWEQREVGDLLIERSQQAPMSDEYPLMAFIANEGVAPKGERYDRSALVTDTVNKLYKKTEKGDFIYSSNNLETGSIGLNKYGKACISPVYSIFEPTGIADSDFLGRRLVRKDFINAMVKWRQGVIYGQWRIHESDFLKIEISVPSVEEQRKIGAYLDQLDNLITLHQRKCALLFSPFQAFISMMFTTSTFSWEQRKLGDMMNVTSVKRIHQSDWTDSGVRFLRARDIVAAAKNEEPDDYLYISKEKYEEYSTLSGKVGVSDLLVTGVGTIGVPYLVRNLEPLYFKDGNIIWFQNLDKIDGKFLFYSFSAEQIQGFINESAGIGTVGTYTIESGKKTPISLPNQIEQAKVGEFFQQLDNLITLHQRKCIFFTGRAGRLISTVNKKRITSSWEQRKFDEVFDCTVPNNTLSRAELSYDEGTVLNVHYGDVLIKYGSVLDVQKDDIPRIPHRCREDFNGALLQDGDVIIADTAEDETTGKACEIGNLQGSAIVSGLHTMVCRPRNRMALGYLGYYLNSNAYHHQLLPLMQGIKVLSLSRSNIQKTSVSYPIAVKEQQLIAYYFSQLDNLITLHQRKPFLMKWRTSDANRNQTNRLVL